MTIGTTEIIERTPFRPPFLMFDRAVIDGDTARAVKLVSAGEPFFVGHFPEQAIMPGVLQVEAMVQLGCLLGGDQLGPNPFVKEAQRIKFRRPVVPGDVLDINAEVTERLDGALRIKATTAVAGQAASQGEFLIELDRDPADFVPHAVSVEPKFAAEGEPLKEIEQIKQGIPHRFPFLFADRILQCHPGDDGLGDIIGVKNVSINEPYFRGIETEHPYLPNYLQMEIAAQIGCIYMLEIPANEGKLGLYMGVDRAVFHRPVLPGDQLVAHLQQTSSRARFGKCEGKIYVGQDVVSEITFKFAIVDKEA